MDSAKWKAAEEVFSRAVELPVERRRSAVDAMCGDDASLKADVLALLEEDSHDQPLLDSGIDRAARNLLEFGPLPSLVRQQIGPYRLLRLLGEGGMGVVYLAERTDIGGLVAIKLLRDPWLSPMRRERFRVEQLALAQLNHPSIARIYDSNTLEDGTPWFVMEFADGLPLTEYWKQRGGSMREGLQLFRSVCEAVRYAHDHAIIHRDLKPSNVLVTSEGAVKLLDFGIAKRLNAEESEGNRTVTGLRMMTPAYAAPEQMSNGSVGVYTDVYALGVLLYELLTGSLPERRGPASSDDIAKPSSAAARFQPDVRRQLTRAEWSDVDALTLKALEPEVERRYRSVGALLRDLDALEAGRPLDAQPVRFSYVVGRFLRRHRRPIVAASAAILLLAATVVYYTIRLARARDAALREAARTERVQQFTENLFYGGDEDAGPAMDLRAIDLLDRGRQEAASLNADPEMKANMEETLGGIYVKLGKLDSAEPLLISALDERRKASGGSSPKVAEGLVALSVLRKDQGKLDDAETLARQGMEMDERTLPPGDPRIARSMLALGSVLEVRGKYDQAASVLERANDVRFQNAEVPTEEAEVLAELANVEFYQGHYDRSAELNNEALAIDRRMLGEQNPAIAQIDNNLGANEMNRGNYSSSEAWYRRSLAITEAWYGTKHPETAANLTALSQPLTMEKQYAEAQDLLGQALEIEKAVNGPVSSTVATTINQLGLLAYNRNQYDAARQYFTQAMNIWEKVYGDQHQFIAIGYSNLGSVCMGGKNYLCAERNYREAVRRLDLASPDGLNDAVAHLKLGRALLKEGRYGEAEPHTLGAYKYLVAHVNPANSYLANARKDLAAIYDALHQPQTAARFRAELGPAGKP
ncbi:MAG: serine/threonine-protein kinase [Acidobacteriaceae bacterium]